jgi:hypothetical protein
LQQTVRVGVYDKNGCHQISVKTLKNFVGMQNGVLENVQKTM